MRIKVKRSSFLGTKI